MNLTDQEQVIKYFLGDLSEIERAAIEERLFTDENFGQYVEDAENDLIDEFVRGELSARETQLFSLNFLVSERRREKVRVAQVLRDELFSAKPPLNIVSASAEKTSFIENLKSIFRAPQIALTAFALLLLIFAGWFALRNFKETEIAANREENVSPQLSPEISSVNAQPGQSPENKTNSNTDFEKNNPKTNSKSNYNQAKPGKKLPPENQTKTVPVQPTFASIFLFPATRSDNRSQNLNLKSNVKVVGLNISNDREEDFDRFRVEVRNIDNTLIYAQDFKNTNHNRKTFTLQIPAEKLASADYQVTLKGADIGMEFQNLNYFYFSIEKK